MPIRLLLLCCLLLAPLAARALSPAQARALADGDTDARIAALDQAVAANAPGLAPFAQALLDDAVKLTPAAVLVVDGAQAHDAAGGAPAALPDDAADVVNNNRMRGALQAALAALELRAPDPARRRAAVAALAAAGLDESLLPLVEQALGAETDAALKSSLRQLRATVMVGASDPKRRLAAAQLLVDADDPGVRGLLIDRVAQEPDAAVRAALQDSLARLDARLAWGERLGLLFTGLSLGSILLLVALGLAICYGLMGVINMAHGELMMIGAYATYVVQNLVRAYWPAAFDAYVLIALPVSFLVAAAVGALLERLVIRHLYGRPLETLLATWGISLVLQQAVRSVFGAQNVLVENPAWLSGGVAVLPNLVLPWNRLAIIAFALVVLGLVAFLIARTRLGLFVRGVTQNRAMAACMGVNTARIDTYAFALGAGIAGLAGGALAQVGNVGPDLGQGYIVDAFMVVVLGGVGQLAGTVIAASGLGVLNKLLEGWSGPVLAKIMVLVVIVVFIQKRPQGLFAFKGREA
ncbi:MAG: urea ABC transporter permease subunit UrtB [Pelomonas sp.]|nr:urea ABC transporter permease subunit UrtB [Roseateles sp.]